MTYTTFSAFKPSFPEPAVWTDDLILKRQAEFLAFQKTPEGIAEEKAFDAIFEDAPAAGQQHSPRPNTGA